MSWRKLLIYGFVVVIAAKLTWADIMVQLNINRPLNDVSDKFISFTMKPEDLYEALDGSNRKTMTRMASMLGDSHVKFVGDYYFAAKADTKLRNPTKIVWKGFNKWTKAVGWSMIIPVPYAPNNWDPMHALKILNSSQIVGINDCIWQLGTDFGSSGALDYVTELKTFNIMVESFKHTGNNWKMMGADISAGSSPDETRRYVDMSRDLNAAYGWIQSNDMFLSNSLSSPLIDQDPALKVLFKENVPVWLTLPKSNASSNHNEDEIVEGLSWAQIMGDAANVGFDSIFKPLTLNDLETPKYSFYVTALFKKIMGSRVYPARPMGIFGRTNKLYTHCANTVSGGLAFMVVNKQERPLQIAIRSMSKLQDTELWQYALTMTNGQIMLNNKKLNVDSNLMPEIKRKHAQSMLQLKTPGMSVSFWVLPNVNLEHCRFTEVESPVVAETDDTQKYKSYSSSDRLLKELIKESAKSPDQLGGLMKRQRRSVENDERFKRFILEDDNRDAKPLEKLAESVVEEMKTPLKRDIFSPERRKAAISWLGNIFNKPLKLDMPLLKRNVRESDTYNGPYFMTRDGKKTTFTKKITEIKKPERQINKFVFDDQEFDEENFFKNVEVQPEPKYVRIPEGDIFLTNIASLNGEDEQEELKIESKQSTKPKTSPKEIVNEMKPLRLLPTEFFEALPVNPAKPMNNKLNMGSALNSLLFPEPFGKQFGKGNKNKFGKNFDLKEDPMMTDIEESEMHKDSDTDLENSNDDFVQAQIDMTKNALNNKVNPSDDEEESTKEEDDLLASTEPKTTEKNKNFFSDLMSSNNLNLFGDSSKPAEDDKPSQTETSSTKTKFEELPWWDLTTLRMKRSLDTLYPADSWRNNMITKDDDRIAAANEISPKRLRNFEYKVDEAVRSTNDKINDADDFIGGRFVKTFKDQVTKFVDIVSHHVNGWYETLTKKSDSSNVGLTTNVNRIA